MKEAKKKVAGIKNKRALAKPEVKYLSWNSLALEEVNPLFQRHYVAGQKVMLARILLKKGCIVPLHRHHNEQVTFVMEGALKFWIDGKKIVVSSGEVLAIPPNVPHKVEALADTIDFDVFSPLRADWIDKTDQYLRNAEAKSAKSPRVVG